MDAASEQNPVATVLHYYETANMSRLDPQLSALYARKKHEEPLVHIEASRTQSRL